MRELVAHDHADAAGVHLGRVGAVEERRLEDAGREDHLVERGLVVRVHGRRSHVPLRPVRLRPDLAQAARSQVHVSVHHVLAELGSDFDLVVVAAG